MCKSTSKGAETADETSADKKLFTYEFGGRAYEDVLLKYFEAVENDAPDAVLELYDPQTLAAREELYECSEQELRAELKEAMREDIPCFGSNILSVTISERFSRQASMGEILGTAQAYEEEGYQAMAAVMSEMEQLEGIYVKALFADDSLWLFDLSLEQQKGDWYLWDSGHASDDSDTKEQSMVIHQYRDALAAADTDTILRELMYEPAVRCLCEAGGYQTGEAYLASVDMAYPYYGADVGASSVSRPEKMPPEELAAYSEQLKKACQQSSADPIAAENGVYSSYWLYECYADLNVDLKLTMYEYDGEWYIGGVTIEQH